MLRILVEIARKSISSDGDKPVKQIGVGRKDQTFHTKYDHQENACGQRREFQKLSHE